jgi:hypothetical protein
MKLLTLNLIAFMWTIAAPHLAWAEETCPPMLAVEQRASAPSSEWTVSYSGYQTAIAGVTVFDGPPAQQASLVPDNDKTYEQIVVQTWQLPKSDRGYWLQCNYANTTAQISRPLPADVSRCDVTYERNMFFGGGGGRVVRSVKCK